MFQLVDFYDLVPGEKYLVGPNQWEWYYVKEMYYKQRYCVFESVKHSEPNNQYHISIQEDFYRFVPQKSTYPIGDGAPCRKSDCKTIARRRLFRMVKN